VSPATRSVGDQIRAGTAEIMSHVRMLHADVISRFALMQEGTPGGRRAKRR
jgi:hypothetical protein